MKKIMLLFLSWIPIFAFSMPYADSLVTEKIFLHTPSGNICGTLTRPFTNQQTTIILLILGSGPTDRNGNGPGMKNNSYLQLANALAKRGIASIRYDKRGIGESAPAGIKESDLRFDDYITDARQWIALIKKDVRFSKIIIAGHSEGSLIGMMAAKDAHKFISLNGPGQSADKLLRDQLRLQPMEIQALSYPIIDSLVLNKSVKNVNPKLFTLFRPDVQPYLISWFKYDPSAEIRNVKIPILIIQGTDDLQVSMEEAHKLEKANALAKLIVIEGMNHIFRIVGKNIQANMESYNDPDLPLSPDLVEAIATFCR